MDSPILPKSDPKLAHNDALLKAHKLHPRERDYVHGVMAGLSNVQLESMLKVKRSGVTFHASNVARKMGMPIAGASLKYYIALKLARDGWAF